MPVIGFNEQLPSVYLERFNPPAGIPTVISVLALQSIALEYHWVDLPTLGLKGKYKCCGGLCCQAFGTRIQGYNIPVWVYTNPKANSPEGNMMVWPVSATVYRQLTELAAQYDLLQYDLQITKTQQGQGTRTNMTLVPTPQLRSLMDEATKARIQNDVATYFQCGEDSLAQPCTEQSYTEMLMQAGYDFQNKTFPQLGYQNNGFGHKPYSPQAPQGAIGAMMSAPGQVAPNGLPTPPTIPAPQTLAAPAQPVTPVQPTVPVQNTVPVQPANPAQQTVPTYPSQPQPVQPVAPVTPVQPVVPVQPVTPAQPVQQLTQPQAGGMTTTGAQPPLNQVTATEITASELDDLLD